MSGAPYSLPALPYAYEALEPHIDTATMKVHHTGHHQGYTDKLNQGIEQLRAAAPELAALPLEVLLQQLDKVPEKIRPTIRNSGGGYVNHTWFWNWMAPGAGGPASGPVGEAIDKAFGSFDKFKEDFAGAAAAVFGSGWAWLVLDKTGPEPVLRIVATANQDNPAMEAGKFPILGLDVWEHAYYLKYQNKRAAYIAAFFNVVNWEVVNTMYTEALAK